MTHIRVLPRDLFNDAKLLKCLGFLTLHIHDNVLYGLTCEYAADPFDIEQDESSGDLSVSNIRFYLGGDQIRFFSSYNDKSNFPLLCSTNDDEIVRVFNDDGSYTDDFCALLAA